MLKEITFATFAVKVAQVFRESASIIYVEGSREWRFPAERFGAGWGNLDIVIDGSVSVEDRPRIVSNLCIALERLGYGYVIQRQLTPTIVPDADREAAIAELRAMGFQHQPRKGNVPEGWLAGSTIGDPRRLAELMADAKGVRTHFEVLARSPDGAGDR